VFETCVNKLTQKPETLHKAKLLYGYFHKYEAQYGELSQVAKLEERIAELFPEDPSLAHFRSRYSSDKADKFDPILAPIVVSPTQLRPKTVMPSIEQPPSMHNSPAPQTRAVASPKPPHLRATNSPKRPLPADDYDDLNPPRKLARGESPLKGAAGRRLDQQRRSQASALHREITFLLGILPPASSYDTIRFNNSAMVNLIKKTHIPDYNSWKATQDQALHANGKLTRTGGLPGAPASADYSYPPYPGVPDPRQPSAGQDGTNRRLAPPATSYRQVSQGSTGGGPYDQAQGGYRQDYGSSAGPENTLGWQQPQASYQPPPPQYNRYQY
jgi:cleavage stimulation factor subunit 3